MELPIPLLHCDVAGVGKLLSPAEENAVFVAFSIQKSIFPDDRSGLWRT
jgi:hypothetical protein